MTTLVIVAGSLLPGDSMPMKTLEHLDISDKIEHFGAYSVFMFLPAIHERWKLVASVALGGLLLGIGLEFGQLYSPGRSFEIADMIADTLGVCFGFCIAIPVRSSGAVRTLLYPNRTS